MKTEYLDRTLLRTNRYYCLCLSEKQFHKELTRLGIKKNKHPDFVKKWFGACVHYIDQDKSNNKIAVVCIDTSRKDVNKLEIYALLTHEAVHIWQDTVESINEDYPGHETEAYAIQNIALELMSSYKKQIKGKK